MRGGGVGGCREENGGWGQETSAIIMKGGMGEGVRKCICGVRACVHPLQLLESLCVCVCVCV